MVFPIHNNNHQLGPCVGLPMWFSNWDRGEKNPVLRVKFTDLIKIIIFTIIIMVFITMITFYNDYIVFVSKLFGSILVVLLVLFL